MEEKTYSLNCKLFDAIQNNESDQVEFLLKQGADPNGIKIGFTPLFLALNKYLAQDYFEQKTYVSQCNVVLLLLQYGANLYYTTKMSTLNEALFETIYNFTDILKNVTHPVDRKIILKLGAKIISYLLHYGAQKESKRDYLNFFLYNSSRNEKPNDEHVIYRNIFHNFLMHGFKCNDLKDLDDKYFYNFIHFVWPELMVLYCLEQKNALVYF